MKHHIWHKSYRHYHVISLIVAVVIVGTWIHLSTEKANSDIKLGYIRNYQTFDSADFGGKGEPGEGTKPAPVGNMANGLIEYVKELIGVSSPSKVRLEEALAGTPEGKNLASTDPCFAIEEANLVSALGSNKKSSSDAAVRTSSYAKAAVSLVNRNPCTKLPIELLPCVANYQSSRKNTPRTSPAAFHFIQRAEAGIDVPPPPKEEPKPEEVPLVAPCTFAPGATAKISLKNTLLENIGAYIPLSLKLGDTGPAVTKYQNLVIKLSDGKFADTITLGVYDQVMVDIVKDAQKKLKEKGYSVAVSGSIDTPTRDAFMSQFADQIDEMLSYYKDAPIGVKAPYVSPFTQIDLSNKVPIVIKTPEESGGGKNFTGDPCLVLVPIPKAENAKQEAPKNPCGKIPLTLFPCVANYELVGEVVVTTKKVTPCVFLPAITAQESFKQAMLATVAARLPEGVTLKLGDTKDSVKTLQQIINAAFKVNQSDKNIAEDGIYGTELKALIENLQTKVGLNPDGVFSAKVRDALLKSLGNQVDVFLSYYQIGKIKSGN